MRRRTSAQRIDEALVKKLHKMQIEWQNAFDEPLSLVEATHLFGLFGKIDIKECKKIKENGFYD